MIGIAKKILTVRVFLNHSPRCLYPTGTFRTSRTSSLLVAIPVRFLSSIHDHRNLPHRERIKFTGTYNHPSDTYYGQREFPGYRQNEEVF